MSLNKPEILVVDDSPSDQDLIRDAISSSSHKIDVNAVLNGEEAIARLHGAGIYGNAARPSLVILDLNLPRKSGRIVLAECKSHPALQSIPVVVFTTSRSLKDVKDCYALGANCYVSKPGSLDDFRAAVQSIENFWLSVVSLPD